MMVNVYGEEILKHLGVPAVPAGLSSQATEPGSRPFGFQSLTQSQMRLCRAWRRGFFVLSHGAALRSASLLSYSALNANLPTAGKQAHFVLARGRGSAQTMKLSSALTAPTPCIVS